MQIKSHIESQEHTYYASDENGNYGDRAYSNDCDNGSS